MTAVRIVSGGQTGVDRGALDAALAAHAPCGGWCPGNRSAEDGVIPAYYPLRALPSGGYAARTEANVVDSDATLIVCPGEPTGGTALTVRLCRKHRKPWLLLDGECIHAREAGIRAAAFVREHDIRTLNVAGPRASGWPSGHEYARTMVTGMLRRLGRATIEETA